MALAIRTAEIYTTAVVLAASPGPRIPHYAVCLDTARLYRWIPGDTYGTDGWAVLGHVGGYAGRWHLVRADDRGDDLLDDDARTIYLSEKPIRFLPSLAKARTLTVSTKTSSDGSAPSCVDGDRITIVKTDTSAFAYQIDCAVLGTIITLPAAEAWFADLLFSGTGWVLLRAGKMTP